LLYIKYLFGPISRTKISFNFIRYGANFNEKRNRAAAVACYLDMSLASIIVGNPNTNAGSGGAILTFIEYIKFVIKKIILKSILFNWFSFLKNTI
jgi:hypothetical protein